VATNFTGTGNWQRVEVAYTETSSAARRIFITKNSSADTTAFYVDGLQVEAQSEATTYCDGDQPGCYWNGVSHASTSTRDGQSRAGGQIINLRDDYELLIRQQPGTGMPPLRNIQNDLGLQDGAEFQRTLAGVRSFALTGVIQSASSIHKFHNLRKTIIDSIKPDRVAEQQSLLLRYIGASNGTKQIKVHYDSGLELGSDVESGIEYVDMRFVAYDPYWEDEGDQGTSLSGSYSLSSSRVLRRSACGEWDNMDGGFDGNTNKFIESPNGTLYVYGTSVTAGSIAIATHVASWTGTQWSPLQTGTTNGNVNTMTFGISGGLYAAGTFTSIGGCSATRVASWTGTNWQAASTGIADSGQIAITGSNGGIYIGQSNGTIASWNGTAWTSLTSFTSDINALAFDQNGLLYAGGEFHPAGTCYISYWNGASWNPAMVGGSGINNEVNSLAIGPDNMLYAGGIFTALNACTVSTCGIAQFNGVAWQEMGTGVTTSGLTTTNIRSILYNEVDKGLYLFGVFTHAGTTALPGHAGIWNGSTYVPIPASVGTNGVLWGTSRKNGELVLSLGDVGTFSVSASAVINNQATAESEPVLEVSGSGILVQLTNYTTKQTVWFNNLTFFTGEIIKIDFENKTMVSNIRGNIVRYILPGSNFASWRLLPGNNNLGLFIRASAASARFYWRKRHWSIDG